MTIIAAVLALAAGLAIGWLAGRLKAQGENAIMASRMAELSARLEEERRQAAEKLGVLEQARERLADAFKALSADALRNNNESFLALAKGTLEKFSEQARGDMELRKQAVDALVKPLAESLKAVSDGIAHMEKERVSAYSGLTEQVRLLAETQQALKGETSNLVKALRVPQARGRWGEVQLHRVVEMAGMVEYCDFVEQETVASPGGALRPDMVVRLPGGRNIVVDSKTPLAAYLDAVEAQDDEVRAARLADHARQVRDHMTKLSAKGYQDRITPTPEFVVMFLPGEAFFSAALSADPSLIEYGVGNRVIIATPTTLIALLKAVAYGWRQEQSAGNVERICELARELHERVAPLAEHVERLGRSLDGAVEHYNKFVGSMERNFLPQARRFADLGVPCNRDIPALEAVDKACRAPQAGDLKAVGERKQGD